ncbi:PREDICTED: protein NDH-DEPENDENT CYCLIC ELECTRON FLOW 5 [Camelina sativa]|uniref:Protein NDH-DEPENDENT CYCLIC ELECTRON FLOW 5 n=1 Tax=Camelina sativa TaxID=90675 RepID=A0ABM0YHZ9_CAMSA|nr:PREDICTED: protein NDH-DEPENDENT CYCLIC ELECTRON FLOW 5 [Camelina sativa]
MALLHSMNVPHSNFPLSRSSKIFLNSSFPSLPLQFNKNVKRLESYLPPSASAAASPAFPIDVEYLRREFSGHGATFQDFGETCIAKLKLENGSSANVVLSRGMVTSYKVRVWHGGKVELLHTWVEQEEEDVVIRGGVSSAFSSSDSDEIINDWRLHGISGDLKDCVQMELRRSDKIIREIEMKQIISLREETLSIEIFVTNKGSSPVRLKGCSLVSYLTVSTPEATYAVGLEGSDFVETTPFLPRFGVDQGEEEEERSGFGGEEESNYKQLNEEMSRIYTYAPKSFTVIDRGRRNSVIVGREGFEEVYMYSPGSRLESYTKSAYVCIGPSSLLSPISLEPGCVWRGVLHLNNPNS